MTTGPGFATRPTKPIAVRGSLMTTRDHSGPVGDRAELRGGGGSRRDYGPQGCAGIVLAPVLAALVLLAKAVR